MMDIVFVIDATGSMQDALKAVHEKAVHLGITLRTGHRNASFRFACVCYRDPIDSPGDKHEVCAFTDDVLGIKKFLAGIKAEGGGSDGPEDFVGAIDKILALEWREGARRAVIWLADAPAHGKRWCGPPPARRPRWFAHEERGKLLRPRVEQLAQLNTRFVAISINELPKSTFEEFQRVYKAKKPKLTFQIFDFKKVGQGSAEEVERLGKTMMTCAMTAVGAALQ
jgi:hypothetical protein